MQQDRSLRKVAAAVAGSLAVAVAGGVAGAWAQSRFASPISVQEFQFAIAKDARNSAHLALVEWISSQGSAKDVPSLAQEIRSADALFDKQEWKAATDLYNFATNYLTSCQVVLGGRTYPTCLGSP